MGPWWALPRIPLHNPAHVGKPLQRVPHCQLFQPSSAGPNMEKMPKIQIIISQNWDNFKIILHGFASIKKRYIYTENGPGPEKSKKTQNTFPLIGPFKGPWPYCWLYDRGGVDTPYNKAKQPGLCPGPLWKVLWKVIWFRCSAHHSANMQNDHRILHHLIRTNQKQKSNIFI